MIPEPNPSGLCWCGCGQTTSLSPRNHKRAGHVKGCPVRYIHTHHLAKSPVEYLEQDCGYKTPCWVWQRYTDAGGYAQVNTGNQRTAPAHRFYWERENGPIPDGLQLDHLCRNRACVRPSHLEPVTQTENIRRGAGTKLNAAVVRILRARYAAGGVTCPALGREYGVAATTIHHAIVGYTWADVT